MRSAVLFIDDEPGFRASIEAAFKLRGVPLDVADDWERGLGLFRACAHELIIADYNLPDSKNGLKLLAEAKRHRPASRLILISGQLSAEAEELLKESGVVNAYFTKTPDIATKLLKAAAEAIERAQGPTDWARVGAAFRERGLEDQKELDEIDSALRASIGPPPS